MAALSEAQLACLPAPGVRGLDVLVLAFGDATTSSTCATCLCSCALCPHTSHRLKQSPDPRARVWCALRRQVLSASTRAAAKSVRELLVSGASLADEHSTQAEADVVLVADGVLAALAGAAQAQAVAFTTRALCALREGGHLLLLAQCYADEAASASTQVRVRYHYPTNSCVSMCTVFLCTWK